MVDAGGNTDVKIDGENLRFGLLASTQAMCAKGAMNRFLAGRRGGDLCEVILPTNSTGNPNKERLSEL